MVQQIIVILLGLYLLGEAIAAASLMDRGDRLCRVGKYLLTAIIGLWLMLESKQADIWHITMALTLSLFVWPKMLDRIGNLLDNFLED